MILIVRTDASILGVGGMLLHIDNSGKELPIAYAGKAFNKTEQKWSTYEQEAFGVFYCISQFLLSIGWWPMSLRPLTI